MQAATTESSAQARADRLLNQARYRLSVPPSRWPGAWHAYLIVGALVLICAAQYALWGWEQGRLAGAERQLASARQELNAISAVGSAPTNTVPLAQPGQVDRVVEDAGKFAANTVKILSLRVESPETAKQAVLRWRLIFSCSGAYPEVKRWVAQLLARYPWLVLAAITLRPLASDAQQVELGATFELYQKGAP